MSVFNLFQTFINKISNNTRICDVKRLFSTFTGKKFQYFESGVLKIQPKIPFRHRFDTNYQRGGESCSSSVCSLVSWRYIGMFKVSLINPVSHIRVNNYNMFQRKTCVCFVSNPGGLSDHLQTNFTVTLSRKQQFVQNSPPEYYTVCRFRKHLLHFCQSLALYFHFLHLL